MVSKTKNKSVFNKFCLKRKLRILEEKRNKEIISFIMSHPIQAAKMDDLEKNMNSDSLSAIDFKIKAIRRLLSKYSQN
jgi:hypothetical protein